MNYRTIFIYLPEELSSKTDQNTNSIPIDSIHLTGRKQKDRKIMIFPYALKHILDKYTIERNINADLCT